MNGLKYKEHLFNRVIYDMPAYLSQRLINSIVHNKIGTYGKSENGTIELKLKNLEEKVNECIKSNLKTINLLDLIEIEKGYKYSILYKYNHIDTEKLNRVAVNINSEYYLQYSDDAEVKDEILFLEDDQHIYLKFHKPIDIFDRKSLSVKYCRYPIVFVFHKNLNIFEVRFDRLGFDNDYDFYKRTMDPRLSWIKSTLGVEWEPFSTEKTIKHIVENEKESVQQIIWSFEGYMSKGLTLKVGEDGIMPFIGEMEILVRSLKSKYSNETNVTKCIEEIEDMLNKTKRFANEKFRILSWIKKKEAGQYKEMKKEICIKVNFNYEKRFIDLINIYENEINDMERIDYVIRFIAETAKAIGEL